MKLKFCCSFFEGGYFVGNGFGPNIRIVKFTSEELIARGINDKDSKNRRKDIRFFITMGYKIFSFDIMGTIINYCPYCGKDLHKFYRRDEYVNEIEGKTFPSIL